MGAACSSTQRVSTPLPATTSSAVTSSEVVPKVQGTKHRPSSGAPDANGKAEAAEGAGAEMPPPFTPETALLAEHTRLLAAAGAKVVAAPRVGPSAITADDALIVVDMQNDFVPAKDAPLGGRFAVPEGATASKLCVKLIEAFSAAGAKIIASKDYHPDGHCSFMERGGPFPPHCVQGSPGSQFFPEIAAAIKKAKEKSGHDFHLVHKGFHEDIESFGSFPYIVEQIESRPISCADKGCCPLWTGGFELKCSNAKADVDAPPDILSILEERRRTMQAVMDEGWKKGDPLERRIFVCGLAMDFCCLDTLVNAGRVGYKNLHLVMDATRPAHIPGLGQHGTGFLTDPKEMMELLNKAGVTLVNAAAIGLK